MQIGKRQLNCLNVSNGTQFFHVYTINEQWNDCKHYFLQIMEVCIPHTITKVKQNLPWLNKDILSTIKKRDTLFHCAKATGKTCDHEKYNQKEEPSREHA